MICQIYTIHDVGLTLVIYVFSQIIDSSDTEIVEMIFYPLVNEACRILEDNIVTEPAALDIASVFGMGFPAYR
jgi:enoyl-CoA hydratase/3-hydroxyacyl-CoA dehydrogenase